MSAIVRKTYDTDSIVIRRLYAIDPDTNAQVSTNYLLATTSNGRATFQDGSAYLSTIGVPTSALLQSTIEGLGTYGYISTPGGGSGEVTKNQLISTVTGLGTVGYLSTPGGAGDVTRQNLTSTTLGLGTLGYVSTQTLTSSLLSTVQGLGNIYLSTGGAGDVTRQNLTSTTLGLGTLGYVSTQTLTSSLLSTVQGLGNIYLSTGGAGDVTRDNLTSTTLGLATLGYISTSQLTSTVADIAKTFSTVYYISEAGGINISGTTTGFYIDNTNANISTLINNNITINTTGGNVNDVDLTSSILGLATFGYLSSASNLISTPVLESTLTSTIVGLGTFGYLSTAVTRIIAGTNITIDPTDGRGDVTINASGGGGGGSGDVTSTNLTSTTLGLGTLGYVSSLSLASTVLGLSRFYVSSTALPSTVLGISRFYVSTAALGSNLSSFSTSMASNFFTRTLTASTITADLLNISTISFGTGAGFITFPFVRASLVSTFSTQMDFGLVNSLISGPRLQFSSLEGDGSLITNINTGIPSTIEGLATFGYISSSQLTSSFQSTTSQLQTNIEAWSQYQATNDIVLSNGTSLSSDDGLKYVQIKAGGVTIADSNGGYGILDMGEFLRMLTSSSQEKYSFGFSPLATGTISSFLIVREDESLSQMASLYISSLYFGDLGGATAGQLTTDATATDLFWNGSKLNNQGIGSEELTSTTVGLGTLEYLSTQALNSTTYGYSLNFTTSSLIISSLSLGSEFGYLFLGDVQADNLSSSRINTSSLYINDAFLKASTYISSTELKNLQINDLYVNTFGPVRVKKSTLGAAHAELQAYDISKYFLFTQTNAGYSVALPTYDESFEGWNCVIRNMPDSTQAFAISTVKDPPAGTNIAPGTTVTILGSENSYYIL